MIRIFIFLSVLVSLSGCEGAFRAKRRVDASVVTGPIQLKFVTLGSTNYLVVLNSNEAFRVGNGSLQFWDISTPTAPSHVTAMDVDIPSNASDFWIDTTPTAPDPDVLYLLDRNENRVLVYDFGTTKFAPRLNAAGDQVSVTVTDDPQRIVMFTSATYGKSLAVVCQVSGTIHFIKVSDLSVVPTALTTTDQQSFSGIIGTLFNMISRQEEVSNQNDRITQSSDERAGFGINGLLSMGDANETFVTAAYITNALFSYQLKNFLNTANVTWDLRSQREGSSGRPGTGESGFRGIARDQAQSVYLSNRSDNSMYVIPSTQILRAKEDTTRNTHGFAQNVQRYMLSVTPDFDTDRTDNFHPRLGEMTTDCPPEVMMNTAYTCRASATAATKAFVLGYGSDKVYKVDLSDNSLNASVDPTVRAPQAIAWYPPVSGDATQDLLFIANTGMNTITVMKAYDLSHVTTLSN